MKASFLSLLIVLSLNAYASPEALVFANHETDSWTMEAYDDMDYYQDLTSIR